MAKKKASKKKTTKKVTKRKVSYKGARKKGHDFERWIANELGHIFPEAKRNLEYQADEAQDGKDIANTGVYKIQAKNLQNYVSIKTIKEVKYEKGKRPVLITKGNRLEPMVVMKFKDWVLMLEEIRGRELFDKHGVVPINPELPVKTGTLQLEEPETSANDFI